MDEVALGTHASGVPQGTHASGVPQGTHASGVPQGTHASGVPQSENTNVPKSTLEACVPTSPMLIDAFAPNPDAVEVHSIDIEASRQTVYRTLWIADLGGSLIIKSLLMLRSIPGYVAGGFRSLPRNRKITLQTLIDSGFGVLAEKREEEIVLGVTGRFWRLAGNLSAFNRPDFDQPVPAGTCPRCLELQRRGKRQGPNHPHDGNTNYLWRFCQPTEVSGLLAYRAAF